MENWGHEGKRGDTRGKGKLKEKLLGMACIQAKRHALRISGGASWLGSPCGVQETWRMLVDDWKRL